WSMDWSVLAGTAHMDGTPVAAGLLVGWVVLIATVLAYGTGVLAVRRLSPQVAGVVACLEAVIATVLAWFLLGEHLSAPQIIGGAVVLAGAFIAQSSAPAKGSDRPVARGGPDRELSSPGTAPQGPDHACSRTRSPASGRLERPLRSLRPAGRRA